MTVEAFKAEHLADIDLQPTQAHAREHFPPHYAELLAQGGPAITVRHEGRITACFGIGKPAAKERLVWCFLAARLPPWPTFAAARAFLLEHDREPLYATVECDFREGARLLELLGFHLAQPPDLPAFGFDGRDHLLFERAPA